MKKFLSTLSALLVATMFWVPSLSQAQYGGIIQQSQTYVATTVATVQPTVAEGSLFPTHTLIVVTSGTAVGTVQLQTCTTALIASCSNMTGSSTVSVATCTVANPCTQTVEGQVAAFGAYTITLGTCTACTVSVTYQAVTWVPIGNLQDGFYNLPQDQCGEALTTGVFAANPANSGTLSAPAMVRVAANQNYLQVVTTAASNALTIDCVLNPPARTTAGKGITITGYTIYFGNQGAVLTSITAPVVNTLTFPATGAGATVSASAGGALVFSPVSPFTADLAVTTAGNCNALNVTFGTPVVLNTANQLLDTTIVLVNTAGTANTYQLCGVEVFYQNNPL